MQYVLGGLALLLIIGGGWWLSGNREIDKQMSTATEAETMKEKMEKDESMGEDTMRDSEKMLDKDAEMMDKATEGKEMMKEDTEVQVMNKNTGGYFLYSADGVSNSAAETIILSFSATWCPSCRTLDTDINQNLSNIPSTVAIYKVDYDTNVALRQKYGVTTQHTFVQIKSDGTQIKKWSGGNTLTSVLVQI